VGLSVGNGVVGLLVTSVGAPLGEKVGSTVSCTWWPQVGRSVTSVGDDLEGASVGLSVGNGVVGLLVTSVGAPLGEKVGSTVSCTLPKVGRSVTSVGDDSGGASVGLAVENGVVGRSVISVGPPLGEKVGSPVVTTIVSELEEVDVVVEVPVDVVVNVVVDVAPSLGRSVGDDLEGASVGLSVGNGVVGLLVTSVGAPLGEKVGSTVSCTLPKVGRSVTSVGDDSGGAPSLFAVKASVCLVVGNGVVRAPLTSMGALVGREVGSSVLVPLSSILSVGALFGLEVLNGEVWASVTSDGALVVRKNGLSVLVPAELGLSVSSSEASSLLDFVDFADLLAFAGFTCLILPSIDLPALPALLLF
jgi:hypothetical protein